MTAPAAHLTTDLLAGQNRVLELVARGARLSQVLDVLLCFMEEQRPGMLCSILLLDEDGVHVRHASAPSLPDDYMRGIDGEPIGPQAGSCGTAMYRREAVIVEDIATDPLWEPYRALALRHGLRACWSTPIFDADERVLGSFAMYFRVPRRPDDFDRSLIAIATHIASIAIAQHRAAERIQRREAQLVEAQRIARIGSYEWDVVTNQVSRSEELCRIFGVAPRDFPPTYEGYLERIHPEDRENTRAVIDKAFREGKPFDFEERIVRPDGGVRMLHSRGRWTFDAQGHPLKLIGTCQDITERRQAERQLQALSARLIHAHEEERARLARELHDDLCQEIAALSIAASNLKKKIPAESAGRAVSEHIQRNLVRLADKVRGLSHSLHPAMLDHFGLEEALRNYCAEFSELTGVNVSFELAGAIGTVPNAVALCVYRVTQEALQNVLKHARVDRAEVALERGAQRIQLTVRDRGVGIDPLAEGSPGLGLLNLRERARMVGGEITIDSAPQQGTTLTLTVPV